MLAVQWCRGSPFVLIAVLQLSDDVGEQRPPGIVDVRRELFAQFLLPDVDNGAREHIEVVGQETLDGDMPPSELVERRRAASAATEAIDGADDDCDNAHESVSLLDELAVTNQLIAPRVVERKHSFDWRPVLEDT